MTASAAIVASAASSVIGSGLSAGIWSLIGSALGASVAFGVAVIQQKAQSRRELIKAATDSAGSHMANVAFDKYVQFCESYAEGANKAFDTLLRHGPTDKILNDASELYKLRRKWALWITSDTDLTLERFENGFREIGASAWYVETTREDPNAAARENHVKRMYTRLAEVMGFSEWDGQKVSDELAQASLESLLRKMLGTEQFDTLRREVVSRAVRELSRGNQ